MVKKKVKNKKNKKINISIRSILTVFLLIMLSFLFWESTSLFWIGMLPTIVVWIIDRSKQKSQTLTVGAMNFAGCFPYLLNIWTAHDAAILSERYLNDPLTIITIYGAAFLGYIINYLTVSSFSLYASQKAKNRVNKIDKEQKSLEERWGRKVSGRKERGEEIKNEEKDASASKTPI